MHRHASGWAVFTSGLGWAPAYLRAAALYQIPEFFPGNSGRFLNPAASNSLHSVGGGRGGCGVALEHAAPTISETYPTVFVERTKRTERVSVAV